ncbi:MAG: peptidoglycan -binding protein [Rhodospirillaceae bacterium]|jgi:chemotaxis protein MotB|nr:peptidoglycan -binding protein [Rhodospirillaceae bacterium]MBT5456000.1 peptidoglycan -binding protein [Rhodospirillaceae bacterium]
MPARVRRRTVPDIWPGFVDAISALLIIVIFLLMVFTLAQSFLSEILSGRNEALDRLNRQVTELADMLSLERDSNTNLRGDLAALSSELQSSIAARDTLSAQVSALSLERDDLASALILRDREKARLAAALKETGARIDESETRTVQVEKELEDAFKTISADREKIRVQLATLESLKRDISALRKVRGDLETRVTKLASTLDTTKEDLIAAQEKSKQLDNSLNAERDKSKKLDSSLTATRDRSKALAASLSSAQERTALAQKTIKENEVQLARLQDDSSKTTKALTNEQKVSARAQRQVALLNQQLAALRRQLAGISEALEASEAKAKEQNVQIVNLGSRLNAALASKVEELARYRSEFFGKLREVLGNRDDIRVEGDRFVFQSEVLFSSGSADMVGLGRRQISQLSTTLKDIASRIPKNIDWVLRVDGHTDRIPIKNAKFPSNWELSTARAVAVVKLLIEDGLPPHRLAAAGFGEYRPLEPGNSQTALRRNRRIEFKLTGR